MALESFYGGRQGASIVIKKHYDYIKLPSNPSYRARMYAIDNNDRYILDENNNFVVQTFNNFDKHLWKYTSLNGESVTITNGQKKTLPKIEATGMVDEFAKGGESTNQVNYGEYVIIDTIGNDDTQGGEGGLWQKNNPDNGKIFRRGLNFVYDEINNPLAGAEYIGQIVGPQGESPALAIDSYDAIVTTQDPNRYRTGIYTVSQNDLVPGKTIDSGSVKYNDDIDYVYCNVRDGLGNINTVRIGFKIPFLVTEFTGKRIEPYDANGNILPINVELAERLDNGNHPFYEKWEIKVPKGIKGDSFKNLRCRYTQPRENVNIYQSRPVAGSADPPIVRAARATDYIIATNYDADAARGSFPVAASKESTVIVGYIKAEDAWNAQIKCDLYKYDNKLAGDITIEDVTDFNDIAGIKVSDEGDITIYYTGKDSKGRSQVEYKKMVKWIKDVEIQTNGENQFDYASNEEGWGDQKVHITYNNNVTTALGQPLNYIVDTFYVPAVTSVAKYANHQGHLLVYYSDPERRISSKDSRVIDGESFPSVRLGKEVEGWVDLGDFRIREVGHLIFAKYATFDDIPNYPPEMIMGSPSDPDYLYAGWGALYTNADDTEWVAYYNYKEERWERGLPNASEIQHPGNVIATVTNKYQLQVDGFLVNTQNVACVEI